VKAIVLTHDDNRSVTHHMIECYLYKWPANPFVFRIPFQELEGKNLPNLEFIRTPKSIKKTVLGLLEDLDDDEWIYWCIDDKYPEQLNTERIIDIYKNINENHMDAADAVLFCLKKDFLKSKVYSDQIISDKAGNIYYKRKGYANFWLHQFAKVKVIRNAFERFPDEIPNAKLMDTLIKNIQVPINQNLYCTAESLAYFGESTSEGALTANCFESMKKMNLPIPDIKINKRQYYFIGTPLTNHFSLPYLKQKIIRFIRNLKK